MRLNCEESAWRRRCARAFVGLALTLILIAPIAGAQTQNTAEKGAEATPVQVSHQIFYLKNATRQVDLNDIQTDLRNMLTRARIYGVASQNAISIQGSAEDLALAGKMIAELDRPRKMYRLTYTMTEMDNGKRVEAENFALVVAAGGRSFLKQGSRVPIMTGSYDIGTGKQNTEVQYQDVGLSIDASLDGESIHTKVEQTSQAEEKSGLGLQDPIVRQTVLDGMSTLTTEKTQTLGALDIPGSTRHEEIEIVVELLH